MTELELLNILDIGERVDIECKKSSNEIPKDLWSTYSAMANTEGGAIILGISENKKHQSFDITGVANPERRLKEFWDLINDTKKVNKNLLSDDDVSVIQIDDKSVIYIKVPRASDKEKPIVIHGNPYTGTYRRNYEGDYRCNEEIVKSMIRDSSDDGNDQTIIEDYNINDIDSDTLKQYRNRFLAHKPDHVFNGYSDEEFLLSLGAIREDRKRKVKELTVAGLLMFGKGRIVREVFPKLNLDYMEIMEDNTDVRWTDRFTINGEWENNLYNFYFSVMPKLTQNIKVPFSLENLERKDDTSVHKAIREAFINALIHADYSIDGSIKIIKRKDRYEFHNLGNLRVDKESIFKGGVTKSRNPNLQFMFRMIGLAENAGSGFPTILNTCHEQHWRIPELDENLELKYVTLKLWMLSLIPEECLDALSEIYGSRFRSLATDKVLALVTAYLEGEVSNARLQNISNKHPYDITKMLHELEEEKYLIVEGYGKGKIYKVNHEFLSKSYEVDLNPDELAIIDLIKAHGYVSNTLAREKLDFSKDKNINLFKTLIEKGVIEKRGAGNKTRYILKV